MKFQNTTFESCVLYTEFPFRGSKAHSIFLSFELLTDKSHDLSQDENKITAVKDEQIHKMTTVSTQNFLPFE